MRLSSVTAATAILSLFASSDLLAQCLKSQLAHPPGNPIASGLGARVARSGDRLAIAGGSGTFGDQSAHIYERTQSGWQFTDTLVNTAAPFIRLLGNTELAFSGTAVAMPAIDLTDLQDMKRQVVVFDEVGGGYLQVATLLPQFADDDWFGNQLALDGSTLVVGAPGMPVLNKSGAGSALVWERVQGVWTPKQTLFSMIPTTSQQFGFFDIELAGDLLLVGMPNGNVNDLQGAVDVFRRVNGSFQWKQRIANPSGGQDSFGTEIAIDGSQIVITAPKAFGSKGRAYLFVDDGTTIQLQQSIDLDASTPAKSFGSSAVIAGDRIAIGESAANDGHSNVFLFERIDGFFRHVDELHSESPTSGTVFGRGLAFDGDTLLIGDSSDDTVGTNKGVVHVARLPDVAYGAGCPGSGGFQPTLDLSGCPIPMTKMAFRIEHGLGGSYAFAFAGTGTTQKPMGGGCDLLVSGLVGGVVGPLPLTGVGPGNGTSFLGFEVPGGLVSTTLYFQAFIADPGVPMGFSATNGRMLAVD